MRLDKGKGYTHVGVLVPVAMKEEAVSECLLCMDYETAYNKHEANDVVARRRWVTEWEYPKGKTT